MTFVLFCIVGIFLVMSYNLKIMRKKVLEGDFSIMSVADEWMCMYFLTSKGEKGLRIGFFFDPIQTL